MERFLLGNGKVFCGGTLGDRVCAYGIEQWKTDRHTRTHTRKAQLVRHGKIGKLHFKAGGKLLDSFV